MAVDKRAAAYKYEFGPYCFTVDRTNKIVPGSLSKNHKAVVKMTRSANLARLLTFLLEHRESPVDDSTVIDHIWQGQKDLNRSRNFNELVDRLRSILGDKSTPRRYIERRGSQIQFIHPVEIGDEQGIKSGATPSPLAQPAFSTKSPRWIIRDSDLAGPADRRQQVWVMPRPLRFFTGREAFLATLRDTFLNNSSDSVTQPHAITGLPGIGKTQTAIEYAYRYRDQYAAGFWLNAESRDSLLSGYVSIADRLELPDRAEKNLDRVAESVRWWLESNSGWLIILDNVEDISVVNRLLPNEGGHCLITTRLQATGAIAEAHELRGLHRLEGALLLLRRSKVIAKTDVLDSASKAEQEQAAELSDEVQGLPLALDQAGAYIEETPSTVEQYLTRYRLEGAVLRGRRGESSLEHHSVTVTFSLAFTELQARSCVAAQLVLACAFLTPDLIPYEIFTEGGMHLGPELADMALTAFAFDDALRTAGRFALLRPDVRTRTIDIHRLVQQVIRDGVDRADERAWKQRIVCALARVVPSLDYYRFDRDVTAQQERMSSALTLGVSAVLTYHLEAEPAGVLTRKLGDYFACHAHFDMSRYMYKRALQIHEKTLGRDHADTATVLEKLATVYRETGNYADAEPLHRNALAIREQVLGPEHPDVATSLHSLARCHQNNCNHLESEQLHRRALAIREKTLGPEAYYTSISILALAELCENDKRFTEAKSFCARAVTIRRAEPGLGFATALNVLARLECINGEYVAAESHLREAIALAEVTEHQYLLFAILTAYATLLRKAGRAGDAQIVDSRLATIDINKKERDAVMSCQDRALEYSFRQHQESGVSSETSV